MHQKRHSDARDLRGLWPVFTKVGLNRAWLWMATLTKMVQDRVGRLPGADVTANATGPARPSLQERMTHVENNATLRRRSGAHLIGRGPGSSGREPEAEPAGRWSGDNGAFDQPERPDAIITPEYCRMMARYNAWQNKNIWRVVQTMPEEELHQDRGAFFGSIFATLNHVLWADQMWFSRLARGNRPQSTARGGVDLTPTPPVWWAERFRMDGQIGVWSDKLSALDLVGDLTWVSGLTGKTMSGPIGLCVAHMFNHQTHHRGQIHAMLTAAGQTTDDTDLIFMPQE